jgi:ectoine hydroxylase-related dioxygenase (phytanoyl-CoA dioxygenase family)
VEISDEQARTFDDRGYLLVECCFSGREIGILKKELPALYAQKGARRVMESGSPAVRSVYGSHLHCGTFDILARHPRLVRPAMRLLGGEVYVYQFKINAKAAFVGDLWPWHQDYVFWLKEDGLPTPRVLTALVFLDEVDEFNGPLFVIPHSHRNGVLDEAAMSCDASQRVPAPRYDASPPWIAHLSADLKYSLSHAAVSSLVRLNGMVSLKAPAGSVLFFHANLVHGSTNNISPFDRAAALVSFSSTHNLPRFPGKSRPDFLVARDFSAVVPLGDNALLSVSSDNV